VNPDLWLFHAINNRGTWIVFDWSMPIISKLQYFVPILVLLLLWLAFRDGRRGRITIACLLVLVPVTDQVSSHVLKPAFSRPRPCRPEAGLDHVIVRAHCSGRGSFPSSHAANIGAVALLFALRYRKRRVAFIAALCAFLVGYSRVYLGVHYPSDVLGGWSLGGLLGGAVAMGARWVERRRFPPPPPAADHA